MKEDIIRLCTEIRDNNKCSGCGGSFDNHTCKYCASNSLVLEVLIDELCSKLVNLSNYDNDVLNALYNIRNMNIKIVNEIIQMNNYEKELRDRYDDILNRISMDRAGKCDYHYIIYFLDNNLFVGDNRNYFINYLMKKLLTFELNDLDIQDILTLIRMFALMFMSEKVKNPKCIYEKLDDDTRGEAFYNVISLDKDSIISMVEAEDFEGILQLVFHECTHTVQDYMAIVEKKVSYNILMQTKEKLIRSIISSYYDDNYANYNAEVEARYLGAYLTICYLNSLGVLILNEDYFREIMNSERMFAFYEKRVVNGIETTVDEAFSMHVMDVKCLDRYPFLNVQYKNNNGKLESKSREEILSDYEKYKSGELLLNGEVIDIEFLYHYLLGDLRTRSNSI